MAPIPASPILIVELLFVMRHSHAMEQWQDQGIVLSVRRHGENGAVVALLSENYGRHAGYVRGAFSSKMRGTLEIGNRVDARWQSRVSDGLGGYVLELQHNYAARIMDDPIKLAALQSACALCDAALPEREAHVGLFYGSLALFDALESDVWGAAYVMWEVAFLRELGFSLDLTKCAGGGEGELIYVSPKTGRAVSAEAGAPYKDKMLALPGFLAPQGGEPDAQAVQVGLEMTGYFLEHWAFVHHSQGIPEARLRFAERFARYSGERDVQTEETA
jgi:DNA repair protein RecO (recombination protein O)